ncbi:MAG: hypothetical protein ACM31O_07130 [Bacteroidota bacterium]
MPSSFVWTCVHAESAVAIMAIAAPSNACVAMRHAFATATHLVAGTLVSIRVPPAAIVYGVVKTPPRFAGGP